MSTETAESAQLETRELVRRAGAGDHGAYGQLVDRYKGSLFRLAMRILGRPADAEDAVQEAFIRAYIHLDSYQDRYSFYTWISTIVTNLCYSSLRARDWRVAPMPDGLLEAMRSVDRELEPEAAALLRSRDEALRRAIDSLPEKYRRILLLRYWGDLSYQEVADATEQSLGAVKTQIRRATIMLREILRGGTYDMAGEAWT